jgi:heterodisulfide reductase subunit C
MPGGNGEDKVTRVSFDFKRKLAEKIEGNLVSFCYQCGACVGDCPATIYSDGSFNPREIMLRVLYGLEGDLIKDDSIVWNCTNCYNCHERCPQQVKPVEVILSLKNMLADAGICPDPVEKVIATFERTGRTVPYSPAIDKQRAVYGLPPLPAVPIDEILEIIKAPDDEGES